MDSRGAGMAICGGVRPCAACGRVLIKVSERPSAGWGVLRSGGREGRDLDAGRVRAADVLL